MKLTRLSLTLALTLTFCCAWAQGPNNSGTYYKNANGQSGAALKAALHNIINPHTNIGYDGLLEAYKKTDTRADGYVRDWYSNTTNFRHITDKAGSYKKEGDVYNREHLVPQSWFSSANPMKSDIVHVVPTDGYVNNRRSSYPLAEVASPTYQSNNGYSKLGSCKTSGYSGTVFEPNDEVKGDIARAYFYMVTCYEDKAIGWGHNVFSSTKYPGLEKWALDMLMRWSQQDPVDSIETARNIAVWGVQNNRNPFVDYPGLEEYVWGSKKDVAFSYDQYEGATPEPTPEPGLDPEVDPDPDTDITPDPEPDIAQSCTIMLGNAFFGVNWGGPKSSGSEEVLEGRSNGITVVYKLGTSSNMYCNSEQIRMYKGNELIFTCIERDIVSIELGTVNSTVTMSANTGTMNGYNWTGKSKTVTFSAAANHVKIASAKVGLAEETTGIAVTSVKPINHTYYNMQGQRFVKPTRRGLYIHNGKKILVK